MASVWSWTDGLLKGFCSCSNSTSAQTSEPIKIKESMEQQNNSKMTLSTTTSLNSNIDNNNNIWDMSWCSSTLGRNTTTTTAPSPTCHFNGATSLSLSASFASPVGPPPFRPFRHREMKQRRVTNGDFLGLLERMQSQRMDEQRCPLPFKNGFKTPTSAQNGKTQQTTTSSCSSRNNLQRLSSRENGGALVKKILSNPGPYPQIVVVAKGEECGFWLDGAVELETLENNDSFIYNNIANVESKLETDDEAALSYRKHFLGREHHNFYALDPLLGPLVLSVRVDSSPSNASNSPKMQLQQQQNFRIILRSRLGTKHSLVSSTSFNSRPSASQMARHLCADVGTERFWPVAFPGGSELILQFDEHVISNTYKFGIIYQKFGQTTEEELFGNTCACKQFDDFLAFLGDRVPLCNFEGYRGGLDTIHGQTGNESIYTKFSQKEVMFHVSTLLPFTAGDTQQLQRKRHIGNDIVAIVFQEKNTPFCPEMIQSNFLHSYLVIQPIENNDDNSSTNHYYRVSISARNDVPPFGPSLPSTIITGNKEELRSFILTKLINAENAALKADKFAKLAERTRSSLLDGLYNGLKERAQFYGVPFLESLDQQQQTSKQSSINSSNIMLTPSKNCTKQSNQLNNSPLLNTSNNLKNGSNVGLFSSVKKAFANTRSRSVSQDIASSSSSHSFLQNKKQQQLQQQQTTSTTNNQNNQSLPSETTITKICPSISSGSTASSSGYYCSSASSSSGNSSCCLNNTTRPPPPPHSPRQSGVSRRILAREQSRVASLAISDDSHPSSASSTTSSQEPPPRWRAGAISAGFRQTAFNNRGCTSMVFDNETSSSQFSTNPTTNKLILYPQHSPLQQLNISPNNSDIRRIEGIEFLCSDDDVDYDEDVEVEVEEVLSAVGGGNEQQDSDTGMESMSSGDLHNSFNTERASSIFNGKKLNNKHEAEEKRLEELVVDVVRLKNEKGELLRQNVTCRTDIKKLKERQSLLATELDKANDEIQRLKKLLNKSDGSDEQNNNQQKSIIMYFDDEEEIKIKNNQIIDKNINNIPPTTSSPFFHQHLFSAEQ